MNVHTSAKREFDFRVKWAILGSSSAPFHDGSYNMSTRDAPPSFRQRVEQGAQFLAHHVSALRKGRNLNCSVALGAYLTVAVGSEG
eukprot:203536-Prorocentrum_minimum.AAC.5